MMYDGVINKPPLDELYHFNKNHDPNNGQFTSGSGGSSVKSATKGSKYFSDDKEIDYDADRYINNSSDRIYKYQEEFDKTEKGKQLLKKYDDAWDYLDKSWQPNISKEQQNKASDGFNKAEDNYLKERQKYAVNKFLKNDSKKFTLDDVIDENYSYVELYKMKHGGKKPTEQEVINYLLNEQWKVYRE